MSRTELDEDRDTDTVAITAKARDYERKISGLMREVGGLRSEVLLTCVNWIEKLNKVIHWLKWIFFMICRNSLDIVCRSCFVLGPKIKVTHGNLCFVCTVMIYR